MDIIRDCSESWDKFGWYEPRHSKESTRKKTWHIMQHTNWTPPLPRLSTQNLFDENGSYVASRYNIFKEFSDVVLVWNTASESIISMSYEEKKVLDVFLQNKAILDRSVLAALYDLGIIVDAGEDEFFKFDFIRKRSITNSNHIKSFIIIPTTKCNARCFYCFAAEDTKTQKTMSPETIMEVSQFIVSQLKPDDEVVYRWFGGEPLLYSYIIDEIITKVHQLAPNNEYHSVITTNSSLMTDELLEKAVNFWHLRKVQIPLDGYKRRHDLRKRYSDKGKCYYDNLVALVGKLLDKGVYTTCRFNLDMENIQDLNLVLRDFKQYIRFQHFFFQPIPLHAPKKSSKMMKYVGKDNYHEFWNNVYETLFKERYLQDINRLLPRRSQSVCTAMLNNFFLINADGNLFRCDQELHCEENSVGNCRRGVVHNKNLRKWLDDRLAEECVDCKFLPICLGGCKFYRMREDPNLAPCVEHKFISDILLEMVYRIHDKNTQDNCADLDHDLRCEHNTFSGNIQQEDTLDDLLEDKPYPNQSFENQ